MTDSPSLIVAGIDVGKSKLDACILAGKRERRFDNTQPGRRALRNWLLRHGVERAVFEPAGRYHRNLHQCLCDAGLVTVLVNPLRSRRFAKAVGVLAGNDRVDAAMLARFGLVDGLEGTPPRPRNLLLLGDLLALRRKLVEQLAALRRLRDELDPGLAAGPRPCSVSLRSPAIPGGSAAGAPSRAACCTWPPSPRPVASPAPRPATNAARSRQAARGRLGRGHAPARGPARGPAPRGPSLAGRASRPRCGGGLVIAALPGAGIPLPQHFLTPRSLTPDTEAHGLDIQHRSSTDVGVSDAEFGIARRGPRNGPADQRGRRLADRS